MAMITVVKPFTLQHEPVVRKTRDPLDASKEIIEMLPTETQFFDVGVYDVEDKIAEHWYVKAHLKGYVEPPKGPGTAEHTIAQQVGVKADAPTNPADEMMSPTQPMPSDATAPRMASLPPGVRRAEPIG